MPIATTCVCGERYDLKDQYAGQWVECPKCGRKFQAGGESPPPLGDPCFARDKFLLRQKHLSLSEKYFVWDEQGNSVLYVVRPAHFLRNSAAAIGGIAAAICTFLACLVVAAAIGDSINSTIGAIVGLLGLIATAAVAIVVNAALCAKRHVNFYRDESQKDLVLEVKQDQRIVFLTATFTLCDPAGSVLGQFQKNYLHNIFRKRWSFFAPDGTLQYVAKEDSIILSLLRRLLGSFFGLLRTNYIILDSQERCVGEFNRKFTLLDRYVLDMTQDPSRSMDRRVAVALGVMLDTGERR